MPPKVESEEVRKPIDSRKVETFGGSRDLHPRRG
jgi:hypothetical protein